MAQINVQDDWANQLQNAVETKQQTVMPTVELVKGRSKAGKDYTAVKVCIGEYETLIFPTKFELKYITSVL